VSQNKKNVEKLVQVYPRNVETSRIFHKPLKQTTFSMANVCRNCW